MVLTACPTGSGSSNTAARWWVVVPGLVLLLAANTRDACTRARGCCTHLFSLGGTGASSAPLRARLSVSAFPYSVEQLILMTRIGAVLNDLQRIRYRRCGRRPGPPTSVHQERLGSFFKGVGTLGSAGPPPTVGSTGSRPGSPMWPPHTRPCGLIMLACEAGSEPHRTLA